MAKRPDAVDAAALAAEIDARMAAEPRLNAPTIHALRREYSRRIADASPREVLAVVYALHAAARRVIGDLLLAHHRTALASVGERELARLARGLGSWAEVDVFGGSVAGQAWRERQVPDTFIQGWARSPDRWLRRAALVATVPLNQKSSGGAGDPGRTLAVCTLLVDDRDDMVVKALSWALRVLAARDPAPVERFLAEHDAALAARVRREVRNKLRTGLKSPRGGSA